MSLTRLTGKRRTIGKMKLAGLTAVEYLPIDRQCRNQHIVLPCLSPGPKTSRATVSKGKTDRKWMLDSGASVNMLRTSDLSKTEQEHIGPLTNPCRLITANGVIQSDIGINVYIPELGITDEVHICDSAPKGIGVLSLGRLIQKKCNFYWCQKRCLLAAPSGKTFICRVDDDVPMLSKNIAKIDLLGSLSSFHVGPIDDTATKVDPCNFQEFPREKAPKPHQPRPKESDDRRTPFNIGLQF